MSLIWDGKYRRYQSGKRSFVQPDSGSGISISTVNLMAAALLPSDIRDLQSVSGCIYVLMSNVYPIIYVGISEKTLTNGVFSSNGRFTHHCRKLLASAGYATNHTRGWLNHARARYIANLRLVNDRRIDLNASPDFISLLLEDCRIAFAAIPEPKRFEGYVLDSFRPSFYQIPGELEVLNVGIMERSPTMIQHPSNMQNCISELCFRLNSSPEY